MSINLENSGARIKELSLILQGPFEGKPYTRADFSEALGAIFTPVDNAVLALGPLERNHEWLVTMCTEEDKEALLSRGTVQVKGKYFKIKSADRRHFTARVHWAPVYITNNIIRETLGDYAEVKSLKHEVYTDAGLDGIATGVRRVLMVGDRHQVPHVLEVVDPDTGEVWKCLVTIPGRPPLCLRCKKIGHVRKSCTTPFCRHHRQYGHATEGCGAEKAQRNRKSYASAVAPSSQVDYGVSELLAQEIDGTDETGEATPPVLHNAGAVSNSVRQSETAAPTPQASGSETPQQPGAAKPPVNESRQTVTAEPRPPAAAEDEPTELAEPWLQVPAKPRAPQPKPRRATKQSPPKVTIDVPLYFDVDIPVTYNDSSTDLSAQTENDEESPSPDFKEIKGRRMKRKRKKGVVSSLMKRHAVH